MMLSKLDQSLFSAVKRRELRELRELLAGGANPNAAEDETGQTALHYVVILEMPDDTRRQMLNALLSHNANPNAGNVKGLTPLHFAAERAGRETIDFLLDRGADINITALDGATPLHRAAATAVRMGWTDTLQHLIDCGANSLIRDERGKTPLDRAREGGGNYYLTISEFLVEWEKKKPEQRLHAEFYAANPEAERDAVKKAQEKLKAGAKRFKLKWSSPDKSDHFQ
jgi:hypothetical protein